MAKLYFGGIELTTGFMPLSNNPIDDRFAVETASDLVALREYTGLLTYVRDESIYYYYNGITWQPITAGGGGTVTLPDELELNGFDLSIVGSNTVDLTHTHTMEDIIDLSYPDDIVTSVNTKIGDVVLYENDVKGETQNIEEGSGEIEIDYRTKSQINLNQVGNVIATISTPTLAIGQSTSKIMYLSPNGFDLQLPESFTERVSGFEFYSSTKENWIVTRYSMTLTGLKQFSNLTVFPFEGSGGSGGEDCGGCDIDGGNANSNGNGTPPVVNEDLDGGNANTSFIDNIDAGNAFTIFTGDTEDGGNANNSTVIDNENLNGGNATTIFTDIIDSGNAFTSFDGDNEDGGNSTTQF